MRASSHLPPEEAHLAHVNASAHGHPYQYDGFAGGGRVGSYIPRPGDDFGSLGTYTPTWRESASRKYDAALRSNAVFYMAVGMLLVVFVKWVILRFTDGLWPEDRRLRQETRRRAREYCETKKHEVEMLLPSGRAPV